MIYRNTGKTAIPSKGAASAKISEDVILKEEKWSKSASAVPLAKSSKWNNKNGRAGIALARMGGSRGINSRSSWYNKEKVILGIFLLAVFNFFMVFFTRIHPIVFLTMDDWGFSFEYYTPFPRWKDWNPTRVLPTILMPFFSQISVYLIYPLIQDYFYSFTVSYALAVSLAVTGLVYALYRHLKKEKVSDTMAFLILLFFIVSHFLVLKGKDSGNKYMLLSRDATSYFFYVIPNLLNCILSLWLMDDESLRKGFLKNDHLLKKSLFCILLYFCFLSNIWSSVITAAYVGAVLLSDLLRGCSNPEMKKNTPQQKKAISRKYEKKPFSLAQYCKNHLFFIVILGLWVVVQIFEMNGGRAASLASSKSMFALLGEVFERAARVASTFNRFFLVLVSLIAIFGGLIYAQHAREKDDEVHIIFVLLIALAAVTAYLALSCTKTGASYIERPDVHYCVFFYANLLVLYCLKTCLNRFQTAKTFFPICLVMMACLCCVSKSTAYVESTVYNMSPQLCYKIDNDIMQQFLDASSQGKREIEIRVPYFKEAPDSNWPVSKEAYATRCLMNHFYKFGFTNTPIKVTKIVPTEDKNKELGVTYY